MPRLCAHFSRHTPLALLVLWVGLALTAVPAAGEIYRCVGADGKTRYTSRPDGCPGAKPHEPRGEIQRVAPPRRSSPAARSSRQAAPTGNDGARASQWRAKRLAAEQERSHLEGEVEPWRKLVKSCNQGATLFVKDASSGMKRGYKCNDARDRYEKIQQRVAELDAYLAGGLEEECRRAGCLPGWIR